MFGERKSVWSLKCDDCSVCRNTQTTKYNVSTMFTKLVLVFYTVNCLTAIVNGKPTTTTSSSNCNIRSLGEYITSLQRENLEKEDLTPSPHTPPTQIDYTDKRTIAITFSQTDEEEPLFAQSEEIKISVPREAHLENVCLLYHANFTDATFQIEFSPSELVTLDPNDYKCEIDYCYGLSLMKLDNIQKLFVDKGGDQDDKDKTKANKQFEIKFKLKVSQFDSDLSPYITEFSGEDEGFQILLETSSHFKSESSDVLKNRLPFVDKMLADPNLNAEPEKKCTSHNVTMCPGDLHWSCCAIFLDWPIEEVIPYITDDDHKDHTEYYPYRYETMKCVGGRIWHEGEDKSKILSPCKPTSYGRGTLLRWKKSHSEQVERLEFPQFKILSCGC